MIFNEKDMNEENLNGEMENIKQRLKLESIEDALYFPRFVLVETIKICNARCPFCAVEDWDKSVPRMSDELFARIADELCKYAHWISYVYLQKSGEPLLDDKIAGRIRLLKKGGIKRINLSTNVSLLNEMKARELLEAGLDEIMFSIDSINKEQYEKMRPGLKYENVISNIENFFRIREEVKPDMVIRVRGISFHELKDKNQRDEIRSWEKFWGRLVKPQDRVYMKKPHTWGNQKVWEGRTPEYDLTHHPCILPWSTININSGGQVPLCGQDYDAKMCMGDIHTNSIAEVWKGEKFESVRELHRRGKRNDIKFCRGCKVFDPDHTLEKEQPLIPV